ncbi:MAG TPA: AI-2E family transporter [Silvibacterium sp.]|nr:AI-2E family transporter [Silvibacterium sp.]
MASPVTTPRSAPRPSFGLLTSAPVLLLALVLLALYFARPVLLPLAMALSVTFLLTPAVMQLERLRVKRIGAVLLVMVMAGMLVGGVGWIVAKQVIGVINDLPNYRDNIHDKFSALHAPTTGPLSRTVKSLHEIGAEINSETGPKPAGTQGTAGAQATPAPEPRTRRERLLAREEAEKQPVPVREVAPETTAGDMFRQYARPVLEPLGVLLLVIIFSFYMLVKREDLRNRLLLLAGKRQLNQMSQALNEAAARISRYLITNVLLNCGYGVIFAFCLYLLHVPNATLWGALMAILRMIPYAGTLLAGLSTVAFTVAVFPNWWHSLWVLLLFGGLEFFISNFIEPHIYGKRTGISAFALVIMAIVWTIIWGWPGLIVSTPMTVCLIVMGRYLPQMSFLYILLGEEAELSPEAQYYERMLAMDQTEAHEAAESFLKGRQLLELYDRMVLPALELSEQDRHKGALDEVHSRWLYQSTTELIAELTDYEPKPEDKPKEEPVTVSESSTATAGDAPAPAETVAEPEPEHKSPVVCVPAEDQADEIAGTMLAQLLEWRGHSTMLLGKTALTQEIMERLAEDANTIICISAVPPFAFAQARKMAQALRKSLPKNPIVVGLWGSKDDPEAIRVRFGNARPNAIVKNLAEALKQVRDIDSDAAKPEAEQGVAAVPVLG